MKQVSAVHLAWAVPVVVWTATAFGQVAASPAREVTVKLKVTADFGKDVGQCFGSVFEGRNAEGRVVMGAGFADVYNTRFRSDRFALQFFVRRPEGENSFTTETLPRSSTDGGLYMYSFDGVLHVHSEGDDRTVRYWDPAKREWAVSPDFKPRDVWSNDAMVRVGSGILKFEKSRVTYDGRPVLEPPEKGVYYAFYYGQGHLVFYHTLKEATGGFTRLYACPWTADQDGPADIEKAHVLNLTFVGETPFAYGQVGKKVVTCSNRGGLYVFDGNGWSTLRAPIENVSYQIYTMINHYDRLLMGQYPSGELFAYDGENVTQLTGWPPRIEGVSPSAREAQTTMIYCGDLFVGVWPWGEVWRYDADAKQWLSLGRMFRLPPVTDAVVHPFEKEIKDFNATHGTDIVINNWGQRVTSMVPLGTDLMVSTSAKGHLPRDPRLAFLTDEVWEQYGRVIRLHMPGNLAVTMRWKGQPTQLEFIVERDRMIVLQDGVELGTAPLEPTLAGQLRDVRITWGRGVFGPFQGTLSNPAAE